MAKGKKRMIRIVAAVIVPAVFAIVFIGYRKDLAAGRGRIAGIRSRVFASRIGDIEYFLAGEGPVILVSHGITGGVDQGLGLAGMYLGEGYRLLCVSRFGYLRSSMPDAPSPGLQAAAYRELLDFLCIGDAVILGNSAGGPSAIRFAIGHPERCRGLILISSAVPAPDRALMPKPVARAVFGSDFLYWCTVKLLGKNLLNMFVPGSVWKTLSKSEKKNLVDDILLSGLPMSRRTKGVLFDMYISNLSMNDEILYEKIKSPTLIIHALDDPGPPIAGARLIAGRMAHDELAVFEKGGHLILGHESEIKKKIRDFMTELPEK